MKQKLLAATILSVGFISSVLAQEKVQFPSTDADLRGGNPTQLNAFLSRPEGAGPFPAVVTMHGCDGLVGDDGKIKPLYGVWSGILSQAGFIVVAPDSHGSRGQGNLCAVPAAERPILSSREVPRDVYGALAFLRSRPDVIADKIAILGQSAGGSAMMNAITPEMRPKDMSPDQDFHAAVALYPGCQAFLTREPPWQPRVPMILVIGEADNWTPAADCRALITQVAARGITIQARYYEGTYHAFDHPNNPVHDLTNIKVPPDGHAPTVGSNPEARAKATKDVTEFLLATLKTGS
jgi:dienelactone hydrolase